MERARIACSSAAMSIAGAAGDSSLFTTHPVIKVTAANEAASALLFMNPPRAIARLGVYSRPQPDKHRIRGSRVVFNSLTFVVFFALVLLLHRLPLPWTAKKVNLLLWISIAIDWIAARRVYEAVTAAARRAPTST
jgi:hypothetical protein